MDTSGRKMDFTAWSEEALFRGVFGNNFRRMFLFLHKKKIYMLWVLIRSASRRF